MGSWVGKRKLFILPNSVSHPGESKKQWSCFAINTPGVPPPQLILYCSLPVLLHGNCLQCLSHPETLPFSSVTSVLSQASAVLLRHSHLYFPGKNVNLEISHPKALTNDFALFWDVMWNCRGLMLYILLPRASSLHTLVWLLSHAGQGKTLPFWKSSVLRNFLLFFNMLFLCSFFWECLSLTD